MKVLMHAGNLPCWHDKITVKFSSVHTKCTEIGNVYAYLHCASKAAPGVWQVFAAIIAWLMFRPASLAPMQPGLTLVME